MTRCNKLCGFLPVQQNGLHYIKKLKLHENKYSRVIVLVWRGFWLRHTTVKHTQKPISRCCQLIDV